MEIGSQLGMSVNDVMTGLSKIPIDTLLSLRNLKGQEQSDALSAVFSSMLDKAAGELFQSFEKFGKGSEGYLETAVRVVDGLNKINLAMESIGKATVGSGMTGFEISQWIIDAAGGLDKALDLTQNFGSKFITDTERLLPVAAAVTKEFTRLGVSGTLTRESFKNLVQAYKVLGPAGAKVYTSLLKLSDGIDLIVKAAESLNNDLLDQRIAIYEKLGKAEEALRLSRTKQLNALDALLRPGQIYLNALEDEKTLKDKLTTAYNNESTAIKATITTLKNSIKTLTDYKTALTIGSMTILDPTKVYNQTKDSFDKLITLIKAPAVTDAEKLAQADAVSKFASVSDAFLTASRVVNASDATYVRDFKSVTDFVDTSTSLLTTQLTDTELQLEKLTASVSFLEKIKTATESTAELLIALTAAQATTEAARIVYEASNTGKIVESANNLGIAINSTANTVGSDAILTIKDTTSAVEDTTTAILNSDAVRIAAAEAAIASHAVKHHASSDTTTTGGGGGGNNDSSNSTSTSAAGYTNLATLSAFVSDHISTTLGQGIATVLGNQLSSLSLADAYGGGTTATNIGTNNVAADVGLNYGEGVSSTSGVSADPSADPSPGDTFASGGLASGLALVGEQGPELVDFKTPGRVYSNPASNDLLSNADLIAEIRNLQREISQLRKDQREQTGYLIKSNYDANQLAAQQVADATKATTAANAWNMRSAVKIA